MNRLMRSTAALLLLAQAACTTIHVVPTASLASQSPSQIWVTRVSAGPELQLFEPRLTDDTIFGLLTPTEEIALAISEIQQVRAKRIDAMRTSLLGVAIIGAITTFGILTFKGKEGPQDPICLPEPGQILAGCR